MKNLLFVFILALSLVACTNTDTTPVVANADTSNNTTESTTDTTSDPVAESEEEIFFTAVVTGDRAREFADIATFTCQDGGDNAPRFQIINMNDDDTRSTIALSMPAFVEPGTYPVVGQTASNYGEGFTVEVFFDRNVTFNVVQEGSVTLDAIATGPGQAVQGRMDATMTSEDGNETATINVTFDFMSISEEDMAALNYDYNFLYCTPLD